MTAVMRVTMNVAMSNLFATFIDHATRKGCACLYDRHNNMQLRQVMEYKKLYRPRGNYISTSYKLIASYMYTI